MCHLYRCGFSSTYKYTIRACVTSTDVALAALTSTLSGRALPLQTWLQQHLQIHYQGVCHLYRFGFSSTYKYTIRTCVTSADVALAALTNTLSGALIITSADVAAFAPGAHVAPLEAHVVPGRHDVGVRDVGRVQLAHRQHLHSAHTRLINSRPHFVSR